jgi:hypothetical protein
VREGAKSPSMHSGPMATTAKRDGTAVEPPDGHSGTRTHSGRCTRARRDITVRPLNNCVSTQRWARPLGRSSRWHRQSVFPLRTGLLIGRVVSLSGSLLTLDAVEEKRKGKGNGGARVSDGHQGWFCSPKIPAHPSVLKWTAGTN